MKIDVKILITCTALNEYKKQKMQSRTMSSLNMDFDREATL